MNLVVGITNRYPNKITKYISNKEIDEFLLEVENQFTVNVFLKFKDYILIECNLHRSILKEWEKKIQSKKFSNSITKTTPSIFLKFVLVKVKLKQFQGLKLLLTEL